MRLSIVVAALVANAAIVAAHSIDVAASKRNGLNFLNGQWSEPKYNTTEAADSFHQLVNGTSANWIALTYCHFQASVDEPGPIYARPSTPTPAQLTAIVLEAHSRGVAVMFRPCIDPDWSIASNKGTWRGMIGRNFTAAQWDLWFDRYRRYIAEQAALAQRLGVDMFSVGMEYEVASWQSQHWRTVVLPTVRRVYTAGPITYCSNWGNQDLVTWWDAVDEIAVDAYFRLAVDDPTPSVEAVVAAWQPIVASLANLSATYKRNITFAEIGYMSINGANAFPAVGPATPLNVTVQANLYEAFFRAVYVPASWLRGVFWWAWLSDPSDGGMTDKGFSPRGKPAELVVRRYYTASYCGRRPCAV